MLVRPQNENESQQVKGHPWQQGVQPPVRTGKKVPRSPPEPDEREGQGRDERLHLFSDAASPARQDRPGHARGDFLAPVRAEAGERERNGSSLHMHAQLHRRRRIRIRAHAHAFRFSLFAFRFSLFAFRSSSPCRLHRVWTTRNCWNAHSLRS